MLYTITTPPTSSSDTLNNMFRGYNTSVVKLFTTIPDTILNELVFEFEDCRSMN